jgi:hypothetical protein
MDTTVNRACLSDSLFSSRLISYHARELLASPVARRGVVADDGYFLGQWMFIHHAFDGRNSSEQLLEWPDDRLNVNG